MQLQANQQLDRVFQALSDTTRRSILRNLVKGERSISDIAKPFDLTFAAVSKHLKVLEAADLIDRRKLGSFQMIRLNPKNLKTADHSILKEWKMLELALPRFERCRKVQSF